MFKEAAEAYEVLSNDEKKQRYDQFGHQGVNGGGFGGGGMNMEDIFSQFGDIFGSGSPFESFFGGGGGRSRGRKGSNLRIKLKLTLREIANGAEKKIKVNRLVSADGVTFKSCPSCQGSGQVRKVVNTMLGQWYPPVPVRLATAQEKLLISALRVWTVQVCNKRKKSLILKFLVGYLKACNFLCQEKVTLLPVVVSLVIY